MFCALVLGVSERESTAVYASISPESPCSCSHCGTAGESTCMWYDKCRLWFVELRGVCSRCSLYLCEGHANNAGVKKKKLGKPFTIEPKYLERKMQQTSTISTKNLERLKRPVINQSKTRALRDRGEATVNRTSPFHLLFLYTPHCTNTLPASSRQPVTTYPCIEKKKKRLKNPFTLL